jgi:hypothetical protein
MSIVAQYLELRKYIHKREREREMDMTEIQV